MDHVTDEGHYQERPEELQHHAGQQLFALKPELACLPGALEGRD